MCVSVWVQGLGRVALLILHARRSRIAICNLSGSTIIFDAGSQMARFSEKKKVIEYKMCILILSTTFI
jgi:hypothetical protein